MKLVQNLVQDLIKKSGTHSEAIESLNSYLLNATDKTESEVSL